MCVFDKIGIFFSNNRQYLYKFNNFNFIILKDNNKHHDFKVRVKYFPDHVGLRYQLDILLFSAIESIIYKKFSSGISTNIQSYINFIFRNKHQNYNVCKINTNVKAQIIQDLFLQYNHGIVDYYRGERRTHGTTKNLPNVLP